METTPLPLMRGPFKRQLSQLIANERHRLVRLAATAVLGALLALALPYTTRLALDRALPDASPRLLVVVALGALVVVSHQAWFGWVQSSTRIALSANVERQALTLVLQALVRSDLAQLQRRTSGWMTTTLNGASGAVDAYVGSVVTLLTQSAFALGYLAVLGNSSPAMAALMVFFNIAVTAATFTLARFESSNIREMLERRSAQQELLHVLLTALPSVRGHFATERLGASWGSKVDQAGRSSLRVARVGALMSMVKSTGNQLFGVGFTIWAVNECFGGRLSIGEMMFLLSVSSGLTSSLLSLILTAAFATDRPVLLLDEATSQVDAQARKACRWDLLLPGRTTLIVEHG